MPTSSQANIMKGNEEGRNTSISYKFVKSPRKSPDKGKRKSKSPETKVCEMVKFDFHVSSGEPSFEGVFAFDNKTNSCRWQISSLSPRKPDFNCHDLNRNPNNQAFSDSSEDISIYEPSEYIPHYPTPCTSLLDTTELHVNPRNDGRAAKPKTRQSHLPNRFNTDTTLDSLGIRNYMEYLASPRMNDRHTASKFPFGDRLKSKLPTLKINNLDPNTVPTPLKVPFKRQGLVPFLVLDKKRNSVRQKTLLEEIKESVNWDKRVNPTTNLHCGPVKAIPTAICFSLRNIFDFAHSDMKEMIEFKFKTKVKAIQYDPVSVRMGEQGTYDRWIVTLNSRRDCDKVIQQGMTIDGDKVVIQLWDKVLKEEMIFGDGIHLDYPCRYRLQKERHNQVLKNFLATTMCW